MQGVKTKELTLKQILFVSCPTCGAATKEVCELHSGAPRTEPHRDRKLSAAEAVEARIHAK
jgi:4-hydroxy-3-methylbut-2-en-1-yl diphosphate synthase IspG/GcpE